MKLLLDENLPHQLRHELPDHACSTVAFMGWAGIENGELRRRGRYDDSSMRGHVC